MKKIFFLAVITFTPLATIMNTANATVSVTVTITDDDADQTEQAPQHPLEHECIYAPHREHYLAQAQQEGKQRSDECVFCADIANHEDPENFILARYENVTVFLNLFPYMRGHLLIIPREHVPELRDLSQEARVELVAVMAALPDILREELGAQGVNFGINVGRAAGASKPCHMHVHVMPQKENQIITYLQAVEDTTLVDWHLHKLYDELKPAFDELGEKLSNLQQAPDKPEEERLSDHAHRAI